MRTGFSIYTLLLEPELHTGVYIFILESRVTDLSPDLYVTYWSVAHCIPECTVTRYILESRVTLHIRAQSYT